MAVVRKRPSNKKFSHRRQDSRRRAHGTPKGRSQGKEAVHKCSVCKKDGHRADACPAVPGAAKRAGRKRRQRVAAAPASSTANTLMQHSLGNVLGQHHKGVRLTTADMPNYDHLASLSEKASAQQLYDLGLFPRADNRHCWKCGRGLGQWEDMSTSGIPLPAVAFTWLCPRPCRSQVAADTAYTLLYNTVMTCDQLLRIIFCFGLEMRRDQACQFVNLDYYFTCRVYERLVLVTAWQHRRDSASAVLVGGEVQLDAARSSVSRTQDTVNVHQGRAFYMVEVATGQRSMHPLPDAAVLKGAPPPPERKEDVEHLLRSKNFSRSVLNTDGAQGYRAPARQHTGHHVMVSHTKKEWARVDQLPSKSLPPFLQKVAAARAKASAKASAKARAKVAAASKARPKAATKARAKATSKRPAAAPLITKVHTNRAEGYAGNVKDNMRRMGKLGRAGSADVKGAEVFSAGYRLAHPGFYGVVRALWVYQNWVMDATAPGDAFALAWWKCD